MKIEIPGHIDLLPEPFVSNIPDALGEAWATTTVGGQFQDMAGSNMQSDAVRMIQLVAAEEAARLGVPSPFVDAATTLLSATALRNGVDQWKVIAGTSRAIMDLAFEALGAVPVVGWVAELILGIVNALVQARSRRKDPPPMLSWSKDVDQDMANSALARAFRNRSSTGFYDWTFLFRPYRGPWARERVQGGFLWDPSPNDGLGLIPGTATGVVNLTVRNHVPSKRLVLGTLPGADLRKEYSEYAFDGATLLPTLGKVGLAAWQQTNTMTASVFNIDTRGIADEWSALVHRGDDAARANKPKARDFSGIQAAAGYQYFAADALQNYGLYYWPVGKKSERVDRLARRYIERLRTRQWQALDTLIVAYCDPRQAAFENPRLSDRLRERRQQLLSNIARWRVRLDDIPDTRYREAMAAATADPSQRPLQLKTKPVRFDREIQEGEPYPGFGEEYGVQPGSAWGWWASAAVLGGLWWYHRKGS